MTDHPTTFRAEPVGDDRIDWDDRASLHRADDGDGLFEGLKGLHSGTLAQIVAMIRNMPEAERNGFVIQKAGDRQFSAAEAMALADRDDFPG